MKDNIKVYIVKDKKDLPRNYGKVYEAVSDTNKREIYITRNATNGTLEHEKYHIIKKHPNNPRSSSDYLKQEIDAELYAYKNTGYPKRIKSRLIGWANDIMWRRYRNSTGNTIKVFNSVINKNRIPKQWLDDWVEVKKKIIKL